MGGIFSAQKRVINGPPIDDYLEPPKEPHLHVHAPDTRPRDEGGHGGHSQRAWPVGLPETFPCATAGEKGSGRRLPYGSLHLVDQAMRSNNKRRPRCP